MTDDSPRRALNSDLGLRLVTAAFLLPVAGIIYLGGTLAYVIIMVIGVIMAAEALLITGRKLTSLYAVLQIALCIIPAASLIWTGEHLTSLLCFAGAVLFCLAISRSPAFVLIIAGISASVIALTGIIAHPEGVRWILVMISVVICADSAAYFIGRAVGGPKLAPSISPSKTWSGAVAGLTAGTVAGFVVGFMMGFPLLSAGLLGLVMADLSIGGDLLESWFKRRYGVKDSGRLLPGHGGLLDRFDGYLLAAPFLYIVLAFGGPYAG